MKILLGVEAVSGGRRWSGLRDRSTDFVAAADFRGAFTSGGEGLSMSGSELAHRNCRHGPRGPSGNEQPADAGAQPRHAEAIVANSSSGIAVLTGRDWERIDRPITNLIANAFKYSLSRRPVTVTVERSGRDIVISVIDQGADIAPEEQKQLFYRFSGGWCSP